MVCQNYNPYQCFYKLIFHSEEQPSYVRFNAERFELFANQIEFDDHRQITRLPDISTLFNALPDIEPIPEPRDALPGFLTETTEHHEPNTVGDESLQYEHNPVKCNAWCCTRLLFPQPNPQWLNSIDHQRFLLGFPGVSLGYSSTGWTVIVKAAAAICCHKHSQVQPVRFTDSQNAQSPVSRLNALGCSYRYRFEQERPPDFVHVNSQQLRK